MKPKILVLYHFYYPDNVVSARQFQDLSESLAAQGWDVEVWPSNRDQHCPKISYPVAETINDVRIKRVWRFPLSQASGIGRVLNSIWMISAWVMRWAFYQGIRPQTILIGTDPMLGLLSAAGIRAFDSQVKIAHWCFDLHPEAAVADGRLHDKSWMNQLLLRGMGKAYQACNVIVDIGMCMRQSLQRYPTRALRETLTPWALYESPAIQESDLNERQILFGESLLGVLYSGTFGLAHSCDVTVKLAEALREEKVCFSFSIRGNAEKKFREKCAHAKSSIRFINFASEDQLEKRLEAADIHLVSLKENWVGTVVPSKFFAALAAGRPVLFEGSESSSVACWIRQYGLGWVLTPESIDFVANDLRRLSHNKDDLVALQKHCFAVYHQHFSRQIMTSRWNDLLRKLL